MILKLMTVSEIALHMDRIKESLTLAFTAFPRPGLVARMIEEVEHGRLGVFGAMDGDKLLAVLIVRIIDSSLTQERVFYLASLAGFEHLPEGAFDVIAGEVDRMAHESKCDVIEADIGNPNLAKITVRYGYTMTSVKV